jgi:hypothetical protein
MRRLTNFFFLAAIACSTFERLNWDVAGAGAVNISDILELGFLTCYIVLCYPRISSTSGVLVGFFIAFMLVYLVGFYNLQSGQALTQFLKGLAYFVLHFAFLTAAVTWLWRFGPDLYWRALGWFVAGITFNAAYGIGELVVARSGGNLDSAVLTPITGGADAINLYGRVNGTPIYRTTALTLDPNHLGIFLIVPLLVLTPIYLRLESGHRLRRRLTWLLAFLIVVDLSTLSRSGMLGLAAGILVLVLPYRAYLVSRALIRPLAVAVAVVGVYVATHLHFVIVTVESRLETTGGSQSAHLYVYSFVPKVLASNPLFGLGLNTFSVYYELVTGLTNWGPHSFYVALLVESGLVGTALYACFLFWVFVRLQHARLLGRALDRSGDPLAARVRPLAWGWTAALIGTMASNTFYLTMSFYYFDVMLAFALAIVPVFTSTYGTRGILQQRPLDKSARVLLDGA